MCLGPHMEKLRHLFMLTGSQECTCVEYMVLKDIMKLIGRYCDLQKIGVQSSLDCEESVLWKSNTKHNT